MHMISPKLIMKKSTQILNQLHSIKRVMMSLILLIRFGIEEAPKSASVVFPDLAKLLTIYRNKVRKHYQLQLDL